MKTVAATPLGPSAIARYRAIMAGQSRLVVHENGVGALNLPYTAAQFGTQMTRATHSLTLADAAAWLGTYLGFPVQIIGSSLGLTKAQACRVLLDADLPYLAEHSFSCDGFQRVSGQRQCGTCMSCLLRRQALYAAGLGEFDNTRRYRFDVTNSDVRLPGERQTPLRLMLDQVSVLASCLASQDPWRALTDAFPSLYELQARADDWRTVGGHDVPSTALPALFRTYVEEWRHFPIPPAYRAYSMVTAA